MKNDILKQIRSCRKKLDAMVKKTGLNSVETRKVSDKMDNLVNKYYKSLKETEYPEYSEMYVYFIKSYKALKDITIQLQRFPSVQEWNTFAKQNNYLSHISLEYISKLNWKYLGIRVEREKNEKI